MGRTVAEVGGPAFVDRSSSNSRLARSVSVRNEIIETSADAAPNPWFDASYVIDNWDPIVGYLGEHVRLTVGERRLRRGGAARRIWRVGRRG